MGCRRRIDGGTENASVTVYWKAVEGDDAEGSNVDWDNPFIIQWDRNIQYFMDPNTGAVLRSDKEADKIAGAEGLVEVEPNIPDEFGFNQDYYNFRPILYKPKSQHKLELYQINARYQNSSHEFDYTDFPVWKKSDGYCEDRNNIMDFYLYKPHYYVAEMYTPYNPDKPSGYELEIKCISYKLGKKLLKLLSLKESIEKLKNEKFYTDKHGVIATEDEWQFRFNLPDIGLATEDTPNSYSNKMSFSKFCNEILKPSNFEEFCELKKNSDKSGVVRKVLDPNFENDILEEILNDPFDKKIFLEEYEAECNGLVPK